MNYLQTYQQAHGLTPDGVIGKHTAEVMMKDLGIIDTVAFCHFIAQVQHESANFKAGRENLNYRAEVLKKLFKKYFKDSEYFNYAHHPEKIANRIYANRMGNGPEASGDGWKYRGTGALQLTGKKNTQSYFKYAGLPLDTDPDILLQPEHYFKTAVWYFNENKVWQYCTDKSNECVLNTSKKINLGNVNSTRTPIGYSERLALTDKLFISLDA
jgi:putative chitinase